MKDINKNEVSMEEIIAINKNIESMKKSMDSIQRDSTFMKIAISGSEKLGIEGLVAQGKRHEEFICEDREINSKILNYIEQDKIFKDDEKKIKEKILKYVEKTKKRDNMISGGVLVLGFIWGVVKIFKGKISEFVDKIF